MSNEQNTNQETYKTQQIAYWPDGYWIRDPEEAANLDEFEAFGPNPHRVTEVDANADATTIQAHVQTLCTGLNHPVFPPCAQGTQGTDNDIRL
ncbi:hypothetical protein [uncultured Thiothrix sp.]|uniref:hypothetical protein n=1 Tax=uncultured Thiothrix sp. TaxID=223185 RepID=UPI00260ACC08|nr:hypothetical protein [uncultured Thiothrix sp.]